jgi:hypothetical protein
MVRLRLLQPLGLLALKYGFTEATFSLTSAVKPPKPRLKFLDHPLWDHAKSVANVVVNVANVVNVSRAREGNNASHVAREGNNASHVKLMVVLKHEVTEIEGRVRHAHRGSRVDSNKAKEGHVRHVRHESHVVKGANSVSRVRHESHGLGAAKIQPLLWMEHLQSQRHRL